MKALAASRCGVSHTDARMILVARHEAQPQGCALAPEVFINCPELHPGGVAAMRARWL